MLKIHKKGQFFFPGKRGEAFKSGRGRRPFPMAAVDFLSNPAYNPCPSKAPSFILPHLHTAAQNPQSPSIDRGRSGGDDHRRPSVVGGGGGAGRGGNRLWV